MLVWVAPSGDHADCPAMQLSSIGVANEEPQRRALRQLLFSSPDIEKYISGVVCYHCYIHVAPLFLCFPCCEVALRLPPAC